MFAQSPDQKSFLNLLLRGVDAISDPPATHQFLNDYLDSDPKRPDHIYCNRGGYLPSVNFDPSEFGIPPTALEATDTSQLLGLVVAKQALSDAGYGSDGRTFNREKTSVILGVTGTQELVIPLGARLGHPLWRRALADAGVPERTAEDVIQRISEGYVPWQESSFPGLLGNVVAGRIANRLDLGGTNCVVDAACASSMSAIHMALLELTSGRSDMALAGGVDTINDAFMHMCFSKTQILSKSGNIRPFSKDADGTVLGEGVGMLVLKRLEDAQRDKDRIYAVIRGLGSGSDGKSQSIYAPRKSGQERALNRAYKHAGVTPESIGMVEAHGTGTRVGDQVEFKALCEVFRKSSSKGERCALGSVKSNIGHTKAAAGTAGLIKTALSLYHKVLLPTLKADPADPNLDVDNSPFFINHQLQPWLSDGDRVRRAGVSAFGFGGSNFHAVLEEHQPEKAEPTWDGTVEIAAFSAESKAYLIAALDSWSEQISECHERDDVARLAAQSRLSFDPKQSWRLTMVFDPRDEEQVMVQRYHDARAKLEAFEEGDAAVSLDGIYISAGDCRGRLAFLFPGQGSQYVGMGRDLICCFPECLQILQEADSAVRSELPLSRYLYPRMDDGPSAAEDRLRSTDIAQPAIGAVTAAMLALLKSFGIEPDAVCGHSYGELAALYAAGRIDRSALWQLSEARGRLMAQAGQRGQKEDAGSMLAVIAPIDELDRMADDLPDGIVLANRNTPHQGVLSGPTPAIEAAERLCKEKGHRCVRLPVAAAFHSHLVSEARKPFQKTVGKVPFADNTCVAVMSNSLGGKYPEQADRAKKVLAEQLALPVDFISNIEGLYADGVRTFVEVGPKAVLSRMVEKILDASPFYSLALDRSAGRSYGLNDLAQTLAQLAALGFPVLLQRWEKLSPETARKRMRISLSGTNYKTSRPVRPPAAPLREHRPAPSGTNAVGREPTHSSNPQKTTVAQVSLPRTSKSKSAVNGRSESGAMDPKRRDYLNHTLATVQQGLTSMQALQAQTTQAHQKYLEAQAEASRTLQQMMRSTQQLAATAMGDGAMVPMSDSLSGIDASMAQPHFVPTSPPEPDDAASANTPAVQPDVTSGVSRQQTAGQSCETKKEPAPERSSTQQISIRKALVEIVGELTGYPEEMLGMEMDIEADLGIDSIKRVEILSAMEDRMPDLPKVTPDMVGTLKTLGQLCDYLASQQGISKTAGSDVETAQIASGSESNEAIRKALVDIVGELTGYPEEMLGMEMDIEADLGIDSIKRVEILSAMEDRMPDLPKVTPDMVGTLKTLGQLCDYLASQQGISKTAGSDVETAQIASGSESNEAIRKALVDIVGELTGYPEEMLGMEMDIEADLGIDSIKRVEILSAMEDRMPDLPKVTPDMVGTLKTLGQLCRYLAGPTADETVVTGAKITDPEQPPLASASTPLARYHIRVADRPLNRLKKSRTPGTHQIGLVAADDPFGNALQHAIAAADMGIIRLREPCEITPQTKLAGLVIAAPIEPALAFQWAQACAPALNEAVQAGCDPCFYTVTQLDGAFGFGGARLSDPEQGALAGLVKTASLEWPDIRCAAIDIDPRWGDVTAAADAVLSEIKYGAGEAAVEIGLGQGARIGLEMAPTAPARTEQLKLRAEDVVVVTGGARGVTAAAATALVKHTPCHLVLLGRSPQPVSEPEWLNGISEEAALKKAILSHAPKETPLTPKALEKSYRQWMANRQVTSTISDIKACGCDVTYFSLDVRDSEAVSETMATIRRKIGKIKAVIHGAGILEDRLITDKKISQFITVYDTKVKGLKSILEATRKDELAYLVLFSSISARMGNTGQSDYAMANEALNKIAIAQSRQRADCKVVAINWGPWDGGMVTPPLKRVFQGAGISLISLHAGAEAMVAEMSQPLTGPVEVVLGGQLPSSSSQPREDQAEIAVALCDSAPEMALAARREINVGHYPILKSHQLDGRPVVPFALITEWLAHGALHANPGLSLYGIDNLRLFKGIVLDESSKPIHLMAANPKRRDDLYEVNVEVRDGKQDGTCQIHSSATALLTDRFPAPPAFEENGHFKATAYPRSLNEVYENILFHGDALRGIEKIIHLSDKGLTAEVRSAPSPDQWLREPMRSRWIADPLVMDCAFQMAIIWCYEHQRMVSLPSYAASYRQYRDRFPDRGVKAVLDVISATDRKLTADFTFLDEEKKVIACMTGYEAVMDQRLFKAFGVKAA